jgi:hypothetical protein
LAQETKTGEGADHGGDSPLVHLPI